MQSPVASRDPIGSSTSRPDTGRGPSIFGGTTAAAATGGRGRGGCSGWTGGRRRSRDVQDIIIPTTVVTWGSRGWGWHPSGILLLVPQCAVPCRELGASRPQRNLVKKTMSGDVLSKLVRTKAYLVHRIPDGSRHAFTEREPWIDDMGCHTGGGIDPSPIVVLIVYGHIQGGCWPRRGGY